MFKYKLFAWMLLIIPILAVFYYIGYKKRLKIWTVFHNMNQWKTTINGSDSGTYFWRKTLTLAAILCIILGLMRPQFGESYQTVEKEGRVVFFVVDTSLSMLAEDGAITRLDLAKYHLQQLVPKMNNELISIVPFSDTAYIYLPLTSDVSAIDMFTQGLHVGMIGSSGSDISNAVSIIAKKVKKDKIRGQVTIVVLSDGEFYPDIAIEPIKTMLGDISLDAIVIGVGQTSGEPIPLRNSDNDLIKYKKDQNNGIILTKKMVPNLKQLADAMGGIYIEGEASPIVAEDVYAHLIESDTLQLETQQLITQIDRYHWVLILALILILIERAIPFLQTKYANNVWIMLILVMFTTNSYAGHPGVDAYNNQEFLAAKESFIDALKQSPDNANIKYNLGNAYFKSNDYENAIQAYTEALNQEKNNDDQYKILYNIANAKAAQNKTEDAVKWYKKALSLNTNHMKSKQNMELILRQQMDPNQSQNEAQQDPSSEDQNSSESQQSQNKEEQKQDDQKNTGDQKDSNNQDNSNNQDAQSLETPQLNQNLSEEQLQYLVDSAEQAAREKKQIKLEQLFEASKW